MRTFQKTILVCFILIPTHHRYLVPGLDVTMEFSIFLVPDTTKIIVTDIDGTITREDVMVGGDRGKVFC